MNHERQIRIALRAYLVDNFLYTQPELPFSDDDSLLRLGIIDSLGVAEVLAFVEETWNLSVDLSGITEANFGSITAITGFIMSQVVPFPTEVNAA
jgi:hypothetical protein